MAFNGANQIGGGHGDDDIVPSPQVQVFSNDLILKNIAEMLAFEDLKSFRQTNTVCHNASLSIWRKKSSLRLYPYLKARKIHINQFAEQVHAVDLCQNFTLEYGYLPTGIDGDFYEKRDELPFWRECGPRMKHVNLRYCRSSQEALVYFICNLAPNLESLKISTLRTESGVTSLARDHWRIQLNLKMLHVSGYLPFPNWCFLRILPNLEDIKLSQLTNPDLLPTIGTIRKLHGGSILALKNLDVIHTTAQSLLGLDDALLPLEHLSLNLKPDTDVDKLQAALVSQCGTLKSLKLHRPQNPHLTPLSCFPLDANFHILTELHLWGNVVANFSFLKCMPSLEKLVVTRMCSVCCKRMYQLYRRQTAYYDPFFGDMVKASHALRESQDFEHLNLQHLDIDYEFNGESLQILGKWMPNLKVFKTLLTNETLPVVCQQWKSLEELQVLPGSTVTDQGINEVSLLNQGMLPKIKVLKEHREFAFGCLCPRKRMLDWYDLEN